MGRKEPSRSDIVECVAAEHRALHAKEVAERCGVPPGRYQELLGLLDALCLEGLLRRLPGGRYGAQREREAAETWQGIVSMHARGFGFVNAAGHPDVYVAPDGIGGALHGDTVQVRVIGRSSRGVEGRIDAIVERRKPRVAGVLRRRGRSAWLEPDDSRIRGPIVLGKPPRDAADGEAAVVTITRFPEQPDENPEGELVTVLGQPGDPNVEVRKILVREQIEDEHPDPARAEAAALVARGLKLPAARASRSRPSPGATRESGATRELSVVARLEIDGVPRSDLRHVPLLTIDPEDARDHDDAVHAERLDGGYRLYVAIADVAEYVQPGTALDAEAKARCFTLYLPDRAVPMLPGALASDLCSLVEDQDRLCLCVVADLDDRGRVRHFEVVEAVMRAAAMVTYQEAAVALGRSKRPAGGAQTAGDRHVEAIGVLDELARKLRRSRLRRGALDFDLPEARVLLDPATGRPTSVVRRAGDPGVKQAYQVVEEMMILANELVASWLGKRGSLAIYRVHAKPDEAKLERLGEVCRLFGAPFDLDTMTEPTGVGEWLRSIEGHPKRTVLEMLLLRSLKQALYDTTNIGHFGLASAAYAHFTSPIRRYPDVEVHRAVKRLLRGGAPDTSASALEELRHAATTSSARERTLMDVEREVVDLYRALLMREHLGESFAGRVAAVAGGGLYVTLDEPFVDVLVRYESLGPDRYEATEDELAVVGARSGDRIDLGDRMDVEIEDVAILRRAVFAKRLVPEAVLATLERAEAPRGRGRDRAGSYERGGRPGAGRRRAGAGRGTPSGARREGDTSARRQDEQPPRRQQRPGTTSAVNTSAGKTGPGKTGTGRTGSRKRGEH